MRGLNLAPGGSGEEGILKDQSLNGLDGYMADLALNYMEPGDAIIIGAPDDEFVGRVSFFCGYLLPRDFPPNDGDYHPIDTVKLMVIDNDQGTVQILPALAKATGSILNLQYDSSAGSIASNIMSIDSIAYFVEVNM